jgi:hypothetical protein
MINNQIALLFLQLNLFNALIDEEKFLYYEAFDKSVICLKGFDF